jgi:hypothetical protein
VKSLATRAAATTASVSFSAWSARRASRRRRAARSSWWLAATWAPTSTTSQDTYVQKRKMGTALITE